MGKLGNLTEIIPIKMIFGIFSSIATEWYKGALDLLLDQFFFSILMSSNYEGIAD